MKILRYVYEYPPPWDGLTSGPYELSRAQAALGHDVSVVCGGFPSQPTHRTDSLKVRRMPRGLPVFDLAVTTAPSVMVHYLWSMLNSSHDLVHSHNHIGQWIHVIRRWSEWARRTPMVLHLHVTAAGRRDAVVQAGQRVGKATRYVSWPLQVASDRVGCQVADAVVCTSERVRQEAIDHYGADPNRTTVLPNGVNTELFHAEGPSFRTRAGFAPGDVVILYVGVVSERKNVDAIVGALSLLPPQYRLVVVGRNDSAYGRRLQADVESGGLGDRVRFKGYVEYADLPEYYRGADVFVLPSFYEGFPKVVVEALACGTPVLTSTHFDDPRLRETTERLHESNPESIARCIREVAEKGSRVDPKPIATEYSWTAVARRLDKVYEAAIARRAAQAA